MQTLSSQRQTAALRIVRWTPVAGATGYQVWYPDIDKVFSVHTNVADLREFGLNDRISSLQVAQGDHFTKAASSTRVRQIITPAARGQILDDRGLPTQGTSGAVSADTRRTGLSTRAPATFCSPTSTGPAASPR